MVLDRRTVQETWQVPPFQREPRPNQDVRALAIEIGKTKVIPGELTLGKITGSSLLYKVDGGHRLLSFDLSDADEVYADVTIETFNSIGDMAQAYKNRNRHLRNMRPDDLLKAEFERSAAIKDIIQQCNFVGFDSIRSSHTACVVSLAVILRCWESSKTEVPAGCPAAIRIAERMRESDAREIIDFLQSAYLSWGRHKEIWPLWTGLNLTLCMWLWRRTVLHRPPSSVVTHLNIGSFRKCLEALPRHREYLEWVFGKNNTTSQYRGPCYGRLADIFIRALRTEGVVAHLPKPAWAQ